MRVSVDLPAPLRPTMPTSSPRLAPLGHAHPARDRADRVVDRAEALGADFQCGDAELGETVRDGTRVAHDDEVGLQGEDGFETGIAVAADLRPAAGFFRVAAERRYADDASADAEGEERLRDARGRRDDALRVGGVNVRDDAEGERQCRG